MLKHIREAIKQSGVDPREITVDASGRSHVILHIRERKVSASASPKDATTAARRIAKDIRACLTNV